MIKHVNNMESNNLIYSSTKFKIPHVLETLDQLCQFLPSLSKLPQNRCILTAELVDLLLYK